MQYCILYQHSTVLYLLNCTVLHCTVLYRTVLYYLRMRSSCVLATRGVWLAWLWARQRSTAPSSSLASPSSCSTDTVLASPPECRTTCTDTRYQTYQRWYNWYKYEESWECQVWSFKITEKAPSRIGPFPCCKWLSPLLHMSQMLYAGQSARPSVPFLSDF